jgi:hypothetical protein
MIYQNSIKFISLIAPLLISNNCKAQSHDELPKDSIVNAFELSHRIELDSNLQIMYKDTINIVEQKMNGLWHYQGIKQGNKMIADTLSSSSEGTYFVREGKVFLLKDNSKEIVTGEIDASTFDFKNDLHQRHVLINKDQKDEFFETKTCRPHYKITFYKNEIGLYILSMGGEYFEPIKHLDDKILILEVQREYDFEYINNDYSTIKIRKNLQYYIRKQ